VAHRIADGRRLERDREIVGAMFCERHARIVGAPGRDRIRVNYGTEDGVSAEPTVSLDSRGTRIRTCCGCHATARVKAWRA
jgi:hypothetical protein